VALYLVGDRAVGFELDPDSGFQAASPNSAVGHLEEAVAPALAAAKAVLQKARSLKPDEIDVKFAIKASGSMNWIVARAATEGNFEITLRWKGAPID